MIGEHKTRHLDYSELAAQLMSIYQRMTGPPKAKTALRQLLINITPPQTADSKPLELGTGEALISSPDEPILPSQDEIIAVDLTDASAINSDGIEEGTDMAQNGLPVAPSILATESSPVINGMFVRK